MSTEDEMEYQSFQSQSVDSSISSARGRSVARRRCHSLNSIRAHSHNRVSSRTSSTPKLTRRNGRRSCQPSIITQSSTTNQLPPANQPSISAEEKQMLLFLFFHLFLHLTHLIILNCQVRRCLSIVHLMMNNIKYKKMDVTTRLGKMKKDAVLSYFILQSDG